MFYTYGMFFLVPIYAISILYLIVKRFGYFNVCGSASTFYSKILLLFNPSAITIVLAVVLLIMFRFIVVTLNFYPSIGAPARL